MTGQALPLTLAASDPISVGLDVLAAALGLAVGYVAYRGYRRNESLPMLFVAAGFLVTFALPVVLRGALLGLGQAVSFSATIRTALPWAVGTAARTLEVVGLLLLLYGLAMPLRE